MEALLDLALFERLVGKKEWVAARCRCTLTKPLSLVDVSAVANTQNYNLISLNVEYDTIVADTKSVGTQLRLLEGFGMRERVGFIAEKGLADALLYVGIEGVDFSDCTVGIDQPVLHRPKTCP